MVRLAYRRALLAVSATVWLAGGGQAFADTANFAYTGAEQTWVVPAGVTTVHVVAVGGRGGASWQGLAGGYGAIASADVPVTAGQTLYVEVGQSAGEHTVATQTDPSFNGGGTGAAYSGAGGGASDVRTVPRASGSSSLTSRLVVAGGGGGTGYGSNLGGAAGSAGSGCSAATGGGAGTASAGGSGGVGSGSSGGSGTLGQGGGSNTDIYYGAGGGGGLYGGGAGGMGTNYCGAGGGGGSSGFAASATGAAVTTDTTGTPLVTITYTPAPPSSDPGGTTTTPPPATTQGPTPTPALGAISLLSVQHGRFVQGAIEVGSDRSIVRVELFGRPPRFSSAPKVARVVSLGKALRAPVPAGLMTFRVKLNAKGAAALKKRKRLKLTVRITVTPPSGAPGVATRTLTLKRR